MRRAIPIFLLLTAALLGSWWAQSPKEEKHSKVFKMNFPANPHPSFAIVVYAINDTAWCERSLRSIFEQSYENFRVIFIDDASWDDTSSKVQSFVIENQQDHRVILIRNEEKLGKTACIYRAMDQIENYEIVLFLDAKDWMAGPSVLEAIQDAYQRKGVELTLSPALSYPSYQMTSPQISSFYAALFKQLPFSQNVLKQLHSLIENVQGSERILREPYCFLNEASPIQEKEIEPTQGSISGFLKHVWGG